MLRSLGLIEFIRSLWNSFWFMVRKAIKLSRHGYKEASPDDLKFVPEAEALNMKYHFKPVGEKLFPRHWIRNLATLYILEEMLDELNWSNKLEILEPCCQDFVRLPAIRSFFKNKNIKVTTTGVEIDAFVPLEGFHSRWDHAHYYVSLENDGAEYLAQDFFKTHFPADLILCFYPFISVTPALAWGLPAKVASADQWVKSFERNLKPGGCVLVVHQGDWEERDFDEARKQAKLNLLKRKVINCPFFPSKHPMHASLYGVN